MIINKRKIKIAPSRLPIWLRRLGRIKKELASNSWPRQSREGFQQGIVLMALGLNALKDKERPRILAAFSKRDILWSNQWKKERAKVFRRSAIS